MDAQSTSTKPVVEEFVDNSGGTEDTDALMADVISQVEQEFKDEDLAAIPDQEAKPAEGEAEGTEGEVVPDQEAEVPEEPEAESDRSVQRLVAREVELRTKENELKAREAHVSSLEQENVALKAQLQEVQQRVPEDWADQLRVKPDAVLEGMGLDPDHIVKVLLAQKLQKQGKEVPKELREAIRDAEYDYKFKTIERRETQMAQQQKAQAFVAKVEADARKYINAMSSFKPEFSKDAPTVAQVAKANPERAYAEIMDEIGRDATARGREPNAQLISYAEAARRVEKRWTEMKSLFGTDPAKEASTQAADTQVRTQQTGASTTKKTVKPLTPPKAKTQSELEQEGIDVALAEYKRVEMASQKGSQPARR